MNENRIEKKDLLPAALLILVILIIFGGIIFLSPKISTEKVRRSELSVDIPTIEKTTPIRRMTVAGVFYPSERSVLENELENYLGQVEKIPSDGKLRILIVPHAGTRFSGKTAAVGFKQIDPKDYDKIIVIGVNHEGTNDYAAIMSTGEWETPLGNLVIDEETTSRLINGTSIKDDKPTLAKDHSIEMITIFLKNMAPEMQIVPILLGQASDDLIDKLAYKLLNIMDERTLLVISTDFSHYPNYEDAVKADNNVINAILNGDAISVKRAEVENSQAGYENLSTSACGIKPVMVAMKLSELLQIPEIKRLDYTNSGDITGDMSRVVGYSSIGFYSPKINPIEVGEDAKIEALKLARSIVEDLFSSSKTADKYLPQSTDLKQPIGAFVTINKNDELRGCIGQFEPEQSLTEVIKFTAESAASKDPRFSPVTKDELEEIEIEISTMTPQTKIDDWQEIKIGIHGVRLVQGNKSGTLLPEVATDNNWNLITFLETICWQKMGIDKNCYKNPATKIYTFETDVFSEKEYGLR